MSDEEPVKEKHWRPDHDQYFMNIAKVVATRATCDRKHVGAVIVDPNNRIVATGYNGSPAGSPHCDDVGHLIVDGHCVRTLHAESNAIDYAGREARVCVLYTTASPCFDCAKRIANVGIKRVVIGEFYSSRYGMSHDVGEYLAARGIGWSVQG